tara:strand:+ start:1364 stop:1657 length:294 start_codon:yes stop_codon:yes gene_type:complete
MSFDNIKIIDINSETLTHFKSAWPCNGIPDSVGRITVMMEASSGDLIDYDLYDADNNQMANEYHDAGEALSALFDDALANHQQPRYGSRFSFQLLNY